MGWILCDIWVSLDILLCTASILSLCAISVDRYLAVTQPLSYSKKRRSKRLAFVMILIVWLSSALITAPPMFGWSVSGKSSNKTTRIGKTLLYRYDAERHNQKICRYNRNTGYVIYSAMGSFFIPMVVMLYVYVRISCVIAQRHDQLSHINTSFTRVSQWFFCNEQFFYPSTYRRASKTVWQSRSLISNEYPVKLRKATQGKSWKNYGNIRIVGCLAYSTLWTFLRFFCSVRSSSLRNSYKNSIISDGTRASTTKILKATTSYSFQEHRPLTPVKSINNFR